MADTTWEPKQLNQLQAATGVVAGTWAQNDTDTLTIDGIDFVITIGTLVTTAQVATTIKQAFNGETLTDTSASCVPSVTQGGARSLPQFRELTASVSSSTVTWTETVTGPTGAHGQPFTMTEAENTAGTGDVTYTNAATAHKAKNSADDADNWSAGAVLANNDNVFFNSGNVDVLDGLLTGVQPASVTINMSYSGVIGRFAINTISTQPQYYYPEYRTQYLTFTNNSVTTTINIGMGSGQGSGQIMIDNGAGQTLLNLFGRGSRKTTGVPCVLWKGSHASNEVNNAAGDLGIAWFGGETATVPSLQHGNGANSQAETVCGSGVTLTTIICNGGSLSTDSAVTTGTQYNGAWTHGAGTITTLNVLGGTFYPLKNGTITTLNIGSNGVFDTSKGSDPFTITNTVQMFKGAVFRDKAGRTGSPAFKLNQCTLQDVTIELASNKTLTVS